VDEVFSNSIKNNIKRVADKGGTTMSDLISLHCPSCGGQLQFQDDAKTLFCMHCGTKLLYHDGGLITAMEEKLKASARKIDITANIANKQSSQIAIEHLNKEVEITRGKAYSSDGTVGVYLMVLVCIGLYFFLKWINSGGYTLPTWCIVWEIFSIVACFAGLIYTISSIPRQNREKKEAMEKLKKLEAELERHKDILAS
jgi:ribosomal protein S27E